MGVRSRRRVVALLGVVTLVATSCLNADMTARIEADGSGTLLLEILLSDELVSAMSAFGDEELTSEDLQEDFDTDLPPGFEDRITFRDPDDGIGLVMEVDFEDIDELNLLLSASGTDDTGSSEPPVDTVRLEVDGDSVRFSARLSAGETFAADGEFSSFFGEFADPTVTFTVELPDRVGDTNATSVDGRRATWDLNEQPSGEIYAESGTSSSLAVPVLAGVAVLALLGLVALVLARRRSGRDEPAAPTQAPVGAFPGQPGPAAPGWGPVPPQPTAPSLPAGPPTAPTGIPQAPPASAAPAGLPPLPALGGPVVPPTAPPAPTAPPQPPPAPPTVTVPTPPAAPSGPTAGWYPDPGGSGAQRWWDGARWTEHLS